MCHAPRSPRSCSEAVFCLQAKTPLHSAVRGDSHHLNSLAGFWHQSLIARAAGARLPQNPASAEAGELSLTRGAFFMARGLELSAVPVLLYLRVVCFQCGGISCMISLFFFFSCERTRPTACIRQPCPHLPAYVKKKSIEGSSSATSPTPNSR